MGVVGDVMEMVVGSVLEDIVIFVFGEGGDVKF